MEHKSAAVRTDKTNNDHSKEGTEFQRPQGDVILKQDSYLEKDTAQLYMTDPQFGRHAEQKEAPGHFDPSMDVNMEATIIPDDVIRAGGFGARDDLRSFLPVASDSTDLEASLLDARDYEEPLGEQRRPGLGWSEDKSVRVDICVKGIFFRIHCYSHKLNM